MFGLNIDRKSQIPLARQISGQIRALVVDSRMMAGDALPSTRELAKHLGVSRNTVTEAYEMLWAEGYVASRQGSRFRVEDNLALASVRHPPRKPDKPTATSRRAIPYDFRTGIPDLTAFPFPSWNKIQRNVLETIKPGDMLYGDTQGYQPLREAISRWLLRSRGVHADCGDIFVTSGATHAISLAMETLVRGRRPFLVENPCHIGITRLLELKGIPRVQAPVDAHGLVVDDISRRALSGAYVTPSHQFPLGTVMSASRRAQLVSLARRNDFCIVEDDYDSEYRYAGQPLSPLYALDPDRVVYVGTFSKTLFPALRVGYAVVPKRLHAAWTRLRRYTDVQNSVVEQATLCAFLEGRGMDRHLRNMTRLYARKRAKVAAAVAAVFRERAEIMGDVAGLHLAVRLRDGVFGREFAARCRGMGVAVTPCARYAREGTGFADTLLIGYGNVVEKRIGAGIRLLGDLVRKSDARDGMG